MGKGITLGGQPAQPLLAHGLGSPQGNKTVWGQGHRLSLHMPFLRTSSCHAHAPLQFPKEGKGFKLNSWISCSKETHILHPERCSERQRWEQLQGHGIICLMGTALGAEYCWKGGHWHAGGQEQGGEGSGSCSLPLAVLQVTKLWCPGW